MLVLALAAGVTGLGTMLTTHTLLRREVPRNYLETRPPSASLELNDLDENILASVRARPGIAAAQAASRARFRVEIAPGTWLPLVLYAVQDFNETRIGLLRPMAGAWPPPVGAILLERDALGLANARVGQNLILQNREGKQFTIPVMGTVHDPSLPAASSGKQVFGFVAADTLKILGDSAGLQTLRILVKDRPMDGDAIEHVARDLALWLGEQGHPVREITIPPPGEHPHQRITNSLTAMMLVFSILTLVLSALLTASMVGGMMSRQVRDIGIMKAVGARTGQIAAIYLTLVLLLGLLATGLGVPLGVAAGRWFTRLALMRILNFDLLDISQPFWVYLVLVLAGAFLPLLIAAIPIARTVRMTVRSTMDQADQGMASYGTRRLDAWMCRMTQAHRLVAQALRNSFRRKSRLPFILALLGTAGGLFIGSLNLRGASKAHLEEAARVRHFDVEVTLGKPEREPDILNLLGGLPGVRRVESWPITSAAKARPDGLVVKRTYQDGSHNSLSLSAVPTGSSFLGLRLSSGRWLSAGDTDSVVINEAAVTFFPGLKLGDPIDLSVRGRTVHLRLVGVAHQPMSAATAYLSSQGFADATGQVGTSKTYRVSATQSHKRDLNSLASQMEQALKRAGIQTSQTITEQVMRRESDGHFDILLAAIIFISILMAGVGAAGLASVLGVNVMERTREFGIMRTIGATPKGILYLVLMEGLFIGFLSWILALILALPLSFALSSFLGNALFGVAFPMVFVPSGALLWLGLVILGTLAASTYPSLLASRLSIRESLTYY